MTAAHKQRLQAPIVVLLGIILIALRLFYVPVHVAHAHVGGATMSAMAFGAQVIEGEAPHAHIHLGHDHPEDFSQEEHDEEDHDHPEHPTSNHLGDLLHAKSPVAKVFLGAALDLGFDKILHPPRIARQASGHAEPAPPAHRANPSLRLRAPPICS